MIVSEIVVRINIKYPRLLLWMNYPVLMLGLDPIIPKWMIEVEVV